MILEHLGDAYAKASQVGQAMRLRAGRRGGSRAFGQPAGHLQAIESKIQHHTQCQSAICEESGR